LGNENGTMENLVSFTELSACYRNKRVFITGHTGFKGSWLLATLHLLGAQTKGYALPPDYDNGLFSLWQRHNPGESILADIRDRERLKKELASFAPDFVFHLAAQPLVRRSYEVPAETFDVNVTGTANVLEAVRDLPGKCTVVVITTDKVYENRELDVLYKEEDTLGGYDPYSASKACTELVVQSFRRSFFHMERHVQHQKGLASVRAGNVIGGGDWSKDRIIPDIIRALQAGKDVPVRNPKAVRPWQHVLEPLVGYLHLGCLLHRDAAQFGSAYNFGPEPDDHLTVKEVVELATQTWGKGHWVDCSDPAQPHEAGLLKLDIGRSKKELNWRPRLNAAEAIKWSVNWYRQPEQAQVEYTLEQIREYFAL
jgi:CDP-glucose 4,6-dehydratase